jgi:mycofactocin precursor
MTTTAVEPTQETPVADRAEAGAGAGTDEVIAELLVEEISIDGMCGVY